MNDLYLSFDNPTDRLQRISIYSRLFVSESILNEGHLRYHGGQPLRWSARSRRSIHRPRYSVTFDRRRFEKI